MNELAVIYENNERVARAVLQVAHRQGYRHFTLRPFNRFDTAFTEWWLVPSTEWPAYKYGKLCFHRYPRTAQGVLYTGYYVEKGLGVRLSGLPDIPKDHIMQNDWQWHEWVHRASTGEIDQAVKRVSRQSQTSVRILIEIYPFNQVPAPGAARSTPSDTLEFEIAPSGKWQVIQCGQNTLAKCNSAVSMANLVDKMRNERDLDYFWMDLVVGVRLRYGGSSPSDWDESDVWERALQPWIDLVHG